MDEVSLLIIIERLKKVSFDLYEEIADPVLESYELDKIIDDLEGWLKYLNK